MNKIVSEDIEYINSCNFIPWDKLKRKTIFITGATGLVGQNLINGLLYANKRRNLNLKIIGLVRNLEKAKNKFCLQLQESNALNFLVGDVRTFEYPNQKIDYIIHGASITSSKDFVEKSEQVKSVAIDGTKHILEFAKMNKVISFVYLSSMEVYGYPEKGHLCKEDEHWKFDSNQPRNSYPISKIECEKLCEKYNKNYNIPIKILRLSQTFGPGVEYNDDRVFMEFARCVMENRNIVLHTKGETERCYLYTTDAVTAILMILLNENLYEIYNVANPKTYCSIKEMAKSSIKSGNNSDLKIIIDENNSNKYMNKTYLNLDCSKIFDMNWKINKKADSMVFMFKRLIDSFER